MRHALVLALALPGCLAAAGEDAEDGADDAFVSGKADGALGDADALRALRVANTLDLVALRDTAKVAKRAAQNIIGHRAGADGILGTADDRPFYTLRELDAVSYVGPVALAHLVAYGAARADLFDPALHPAALPAELAGDPNAAGLISAIAGDASLAIDGDPATMISNEWELGLLYAHHFAAEQAPRIAALRGYLVANDPRRGPFINIGTLYRGMFGEGGLADTIDALARRTAVDPRHVAGRIYASELASALADPDFANAHPSIQFFEDEFLSVWNAHVDVTDPGTLPLDRAQVRALLQLRGVATFDTAYPADRPMPAVLAATAFPLPFPTGSEIVCMQGNNSMSAQASHGPDELRYALDLNALPFTPVVASAAGTAYVYDDGRVDSYDNFGYGNMLLIDLHDGYALLYAHLSTFTVATGQSVIAGQQVGTVGNTGAAGADSHLHFQVVSLFRTPDPAHEKYQSDVPIAHDGPFNGPEPFVMSAIDVTNGDAAAHPIASTAFVGGEAANLRGAAHVYRAP
jgi:murein DD-endopeptidase MepM/ murein hydrolase activator NlpD